MRKWMAMIAGLAFSLACVPRASAAYEVWLSTRENGSANGSVYH
jgi:hypothetical protein